MKSVLLLVAVLLIGRGAEALEFADPPALSAAVLAIDPPPSMTVPLAKIQPRARPLRPEIMERRGHRW